MIAEHETLKLWLLLLKRQMMTMPLLPKIALLSPSISNAPIQRLLDWDKARIMKCFGLESGGVLAARQAYYTELSLDGTQAAPCDRPSPASPADDWVTAIQGYCCSSTLGLGRRQALLLGLICSWQGLQTQSSYIRRNNNPFSHMLTLQS